VQPLAVGDPDLEEDLAYLRECQHRVPGAAELLVEEDRGWTYCRFVDPEADKPDRISPDSPV
jgi:hypothetical protein